MIGWLAAAAVFTMGAAQDVDAPGTVPPMEIHLRQVDAVDLLYVLASVHGKAQFVVRPATDVRVTFEHQRIKPDALRNQLGTQLGLHPTRAGDIEVWVPACASPEYRPIDFPLAEKATMNFNAISTGALLNLIADLEGLEFSAPDGYPDVNLSVQVDHRTSEEIASVVSGALGVEFKIVAKTLEVRPAAKAPKCSASQYRWFKEEKSSSPPASGEPRQYFGNKKCGRVAKFPASAATPCRWYEAFALADFQIRGYVMLTPHGPQLAYMNPKQDSVDSAPLLALDGFRFSEDFVAVTDVGTDAVLLAQYEQREGAKPQAKRAMSVSYADGHIQDREITADDRFPVGKEYFERYGLEDLLVVSTRQEEGVWSAQIRTIHGPEQTVKRGSYLGPHSGKIVSIDADGLELLELVQDATNAWYESAVRLERNQWYSRPRDVLRRRLALREVRTPVQLEFLNAASRVDLAAMGGLASKGADIDARYGEYNALFEATFLRKVDATETVRWLLDHGARADGFFGKYESTPLTEAVQRGSLAMTKLLLEAGANPEIGDIHEWTPLYFAAQSGHTEIARLLLAHHANPRSPSDLGLTPFLIAAYHGNADVVKLFMNAGIALSEVDRNGQTMLWAAVQGGQTDLMRILIEAGADVNARDRWGKSILDAAREKGDEKVVALLVSKGARPGRSEAQVSGK